MYLNSPLSPSRRSFLQKAAGGFGGFALSSMLSASDGLSSGSGFGPAGEGFFRLSAFGHRENVEAAVSSIRGKLQI